MKRLQIIFFLFVTLLFGNKLFAQDETNIKINNGEEICDYLNEYCRKRSEILDSIKNLKKSISRDKQLNANEFSLDHFTLGVEYFYVGDYTNALLELNKVEPYELPSDLAVYRGLIYLNQGKTDSALKEFNTAVGKNSDYSLAYFGRAEVYRHKRRYDEALENYNRALEKEFRFSKAFYGRGIVYLKRGDIFRQNKNEQLAEVSYKNALKDFNMVIEIELNRTNPETYLYRSKVYEALGDDANAEQDRKTYHELNEKGDG